MKDLFKFIAIVLLGVGFSLTSNFAVHALTIQEVNATDQNGNNTTVGNPSIFNTWLEVTINAADVGSSFGINWVLSSSDSKLATDLGAEAVFTINSFTQDVLSLTTRITNTTDVTFQSAILSLGFGVDPNAAATVTTPGAVFDNVGAGKSPNQNFPGGFKLIDVCAFAQNCGGGSINSGLASGATDIFTINIQSLATGGFSNPPQVTLSAFPIKFQSQGGSFEFPASPSQTAIPEPSTLLLIGAGLVGLACYRKSRE